MTGFALISSSSELIVSLMKARQTGSFNVVNVALNEVTEDKTNSDCRGNKYTI